MLDDGNIEKFEPSDFDFTVMSATVMSGDAAEEQEEFGSTACYCCGLTEECTAAYVAAVRARFGGRWICGLCAEAVEEEICRSARLISLEEALQRQASFCLSFRSAALPPAADACDDLITVVRRLIRRSLGSTPRLLRSSSDTTSRKGISVPGQLLSRKDSCLASIGSSRLSKVGDVDLLRAKGFNFN